MRFHGGGSEADKIFLDARMARVSSQGMTENEIGKRVVDAAIRTHRNLGPGLLESVYETVLAYELRRDRLDVDRQVAIPVVYGNMRFDEGFRADLAIESKIIVELKCVENLNNAHKKQLLTYLRLTGMKLGFLLNFSEGLMKHGISRVINGLNESTEKYLCGFAPWRDFSENG